jgi:hypothetical protein
VTGQIVLRYRIERNRSMNEVQTYAGDPNVEANWPDAGMISGGKATIPDLTPGPTSGSASAPPDCAA